MKWRYSKRVICLQFREYSCGKFVSNILSYNNNFLPQFNLDTIDLTSAYYDINFKHEIIMNTIPNNSLLKNWRKFELGNENFYGYNFTDPTVYNKIIHPGTNSVKITAFDNLILSKIKEKVKEILETTDYFVFIISHRPIFTRLIQELFPNVILVEFINDQLVNKLSQKIKTTKEKNTFGLVSFNNSEIKFDIGTLFSKKDFFQEIKLFMYNLGCSDIDLDEKVKEYYNKYISLYKPHLNTV